MPNVMVAVCSLSLFAFQLILAGTGGAGSDPAKFLVHQFGFYALVFLLATLSVSSIARFARRPHLVFWRRPVGLASFFFASAHVVVYVALYQGWDAQVIVEDIRDHPYILIGLLAWGLLIPLAVTSTRSARRRMGRNWALLHRVIYMIAPLAILHQAMAQKADLSQTLIFSAILGCFLFERVLRLRP